RLRVPQPSYYIRIIANTRRLGKTPRPLLCLDVTTRLQPYRVKGDGHNQITHIAKPARREFASVNISKTESDPRTITVLQRVKESLYFSFFPEPQERGCCCHGNSSPQAGRQGIFRIEVHVRSGKIAEAFRAKNVLPFHQGAKTPFAVVRVNQ